MVGIELDYPVTEREVRIPVRENGLDEARAVVLVKLAHAIRKLDASMLSDVCLTRTLVSTARLMCEGLSARAAATAAMLPPLCDDAEAVRGLREVVNTYLPE